MNNFGTDSRDTHWQAAQLSQPRIVLWPTNHLGEPATIDELMSETGAYAKRRADAMIRTTQYRGNVDRTGVLP